MSTAKTTMTRSAAFTGWCWPLVVQRTASQLPNRSRRRGRFRSRTSAGPGELGADVSNMAVDRAVGDVDVAVVGGIEDQLACKDNTRSREQLLRIVNSMAVSAIGVPERSPCGEDRSPAHHGPGLAFHGRRGISRPSQDHLDPRDEFARTERLRDVVVAADFEAKDAVDLFVSGGQEQDRRIRFPYSSDTFGPSISGMPMSSTMRSSTLRLNRASASLPSWAMDIVMPLFSRVKRMTSRICGSSSTRSME